jgi:glycine cleavage system aminomethyltransferase T
MYRSTPLDQRVGASDMTMETYIRREAPCWYAVSTRSRHEKVAAMTWEASELCIFFRCSLKSANGAIERK